MAKGNSNKNPDKGKQVGKRKSSASQSTFQPESESGPSKKPKLFEDETNPLVGPSLPKGTVSSGSSGNRFMKRIRKDIQELYSNPMEGILLLTDDRDVSKMSALIVGPRGTPYEGGFFRFHIAFPDNYPAKPPHVRLMTTDDGRVRFNPNFYECGKVCLSILGTFSGPQWRPTQTLSSVLVSIQSLMTEEPHRNEPGYENMKVNDPTVAGYADMIAHETLRVAVCDTLEGRTYCPKTLLHNFVRKAFLERFADYLLMAKRRRYLDGLEFYDFLDGCHGIFEFDVIVKRLKRIRKELIEAKNRDVEREADQHAQGI